MTVRESISEADHDLTVFFISRPCEPREAVLIGCDGGCVPAWDV